MTGVELIVAERERQVSQEGWSSEHDDSHDGAELATAAVCYVLYGHHINGRVPDLWPWDAPWWKPSKDAVRNLVKAGALIAAEIDRLQRAANSQEPPQKGR
jgi:hypothetical protein